MPSTFPEMVKYILYGHGVQSTGIFTPKMWFFDPNIKPFAYDPEKARAASRRSRLETRQRRNPRKGWPAFFISL